MSAEFVITGASGGVATRLEINDLIRDEKFFSLYIQALQAMSNSDQAQTESFFQIGGIHGLPYVPWAGATGDRDPDTTWGGYCIHGSTLFPTWHRPYMMLIEQILQKHALEIAQTYTVNQAAWVAAANALRQPYWDWARNATPPPEVISLTQVPITGPNGTRITVNNPLVAYRFHPIDRSFPRPYSSWPTTLRQPTSTRPDAQANVTRLRRVLQSAQSDITQSTYSMLTRVRTWPAFASHTVGDGGSSSNSIEAVHDSIHVYVGGNGHMSDPSVAAFDPIFFLHHANVDRMISLWSAINPGVWISNGDSQDGSFTLPPEIPVDATTALTPFWNGPSSFWNSSATTDTTKLGYTYPEFVGLDLGNTSAVRTAIGRAVNRLYGGVFSGFETVSPQPAAEAEKAVEAEAVAPAAAAAPEAEVANQKPFAAFAERSVPRSAPRHNPASSHHAVAAPNCGLWDWTARVEFKKYELGTSFSVLLFLGSVPEDTDEWLVSDNFVGGHHAFVNSAAGHCANCRNSSNIVEEGFVHLDKALVDLSGLHSLNPDEVVPYLTENLQWRVLKTDGEIAELESLEVCVTGTPLSYPPGAMFPVPGESQRYDVITRGRTGGSRHPPA
ncbi:tyrosinase [Panaeolus papilionaceus]|nr:tyrosinase [Panaeolus papilionaceus]